MVLSKFPGSFSRQFEWHTGESPREKTAGKYQQFKTADSLKLLKEYFPATESQYWISETSTIKSLPSSVMSIFSGLCSLKLKTNGIKSFWCAPLSSLHSLDRQPVSPPFPTTYSVRILPHLCTLVHSNWSNLKYHLTKAFVTSGNSKFELDKSTCLPQLRDRIQLVFISKLVLFVIVVV